MDKYEAIHGTDVSSFDFTSTHRLPTVSAAQAFDDLNAGSQQFVHTGLEALDRALGGASPRFGNGNDGDGDGDGPRRSRGFRKGQVVEVWGPPASGKTAFAMQIAAHALRDGHRVVWVDTFHPFCYNRFDEIVSLSCSPSTGVTAPLGASDAIANIVHYSTPSLAHLIALLCKPAASSIPGGTSLIVIDGLSGLINRAFPKNITPRQTSKDPSPATRRLQVLQSIISALQKLSATQNLLIMILSQCATKMQVERGAAITPAISTSSWEQGIATRLVLFQDWTTVNAELRNVRLVGVQKSNNQVSPNGIGLVFPFEIRSGGLAALDLETNRPSFVLATNPHRPKRKLDETGFEIADSEGEDYGWEEEDDAEMPNMPPQWAGSEDLLLGPAEEDVNSTGEISEPGSSCKDDTPHLEYE
ncbi:putative RAD55 protein [Rosellinia necatrix]|uniref:Putative RAD55 protein n=1 Tax=Rosellinia necatrix TaxID=77044 RepID=A0A1W2TVY6_ROSNE|nr:putative RAD55 protein [Rosellinia necatrix]